MGGVKPGKNAMISVVEDETLTICRAQSGDREAFGELVRFYHEGMVNMVYRMCGDPSLADDAAQMAFIRAWEHLADYQPRFAFRNWLYRIAVNAALDLLRREKPAEDFDALALASNSERVEAQIEKKQRNELVRRAVLALPAASRAVLVLREYEGLSYQEIAQVLDIPNGTVMSRLSYARTRLAEWLRQYMEEV
jgi:RNA polymerase sigma-70 factor, ECF subfamily